MKQKVHKNAFNYTCFQREKARTPHNGLNQHQWKGKDYKKSFTKMLCVLMDPIPGNGKCEKWNFIHLSTSFFISILICSHQVTQSVMLPISACFRHI